MPSPAATRRCSAWACCGGYCARLLTDWLGDGPLRRLRIRFASRFWPDDVLTCSAPVTGKREDDGEGLVEREFSAVNQNGQVVIRGDATAPCPLVVSRGTRR